MKVRSGWRSRRVRGTCEGRLTKLAELSDVPPAAPPEVRPDQKIVESHIEGNNPFECHPRKDVAKNYKPRSEDASRHLIWVNYDEEHSR